MLTHCYVNNKAISIAQCEIRIRESINSPIIEGDLIIQDYNIIDYKNIQEQSEIPLNIVTYDLIEDKIHEYIFTIYAIEGGSIQMGNIVSLKFTSRGGIHLNSINTPFTYSEMKYSTMIKRLIKTVDIKTSKDHFLESFGNKTVALPYCSILDKIRYVKDKMQAKSTAAGYLIFPDLETNEMNVINLQYIMDEKFGKYDKKMFKNFETESYVGHVSNLYVIKNHDILKGISQINSSYATVDINTGEVVTLTKNIKENKNLPVLANDKNLHGKFSSITNPIFYDNDSLLRDISNDFYKYIQNQIVINVEANGDYERKCGYVVEMVAFKQSKDRGLIFDEKISGRYIIKDLEHVIAKDKYYHNTNLIKI